MSHMVFCQKLKKEAPGLDRPPFPSAMGEKIYNGISKEAWGLWLKQQTILINEKRLNLTDANARAEITQAMEVFLFGDKI